MLTIGRIYDIIYTNTDGRYIQTLTEGKTDDIPQENTERVAFATLTEEFTMKSIDAFGDFRSDIGWILNNGRKRFKW